MLPEHDSNAQKPGGERRSTGSARKLVKTLAFMILLGATAWGSYSFRGSPAETWLAGVVGSNQATSHAKELYYCPMHPTYHSDKPGTCPICGMNLVKAEPGENPSEEAQAPEKKAAGERKILYWVDSMNPSFRSDKPGKAPDGMDLVPVYADETAPSKALPAGSVKVSAQKQQLIGVEYGEVVEQNLSKTLRTVGKVVVDETRVAHVHTRVAGWIEKVYVDFTGKLVKKGQPLLSIYSPDLVSTQQELLIAKKSKEILENSSFSGIGPNATSLYQATRDRLRLWDITDAQMNEVEKRGRPMLALTLQASVNGYVLMRNAFPGQQVSPELDLYTIADLSSVWVLADVYEYELPSIKVGQTATMTLNSYPGKVFSGKVSYINPELDPTTRSAKARIEFANPDLLLKPDMFTNVEFKINYGKRLTVTRDAVLDSGSSQTVFIAKEGGYFEPRKVSLGQLVGDRYIVLDGLKAGERIVTSANFLIDSESQLKAAMGATSSDSGKKGAAVESGVGGTAVPVLANPPSQPDHSQHGMKESEVDGKGKTVTPKSENAAVKKAPKDHSSHAD